MDRHPIPRHSYIMPLGFFEWLLVGFLFVNGGIYLYGGGRRSSEVDR